MSQRKCMHGYGVVAQQLLAASPLRAAVQQRLYHSTEHEHNTALSSYTRLAVAHPTRAGTPARACCRSVLPACAAAHDHLCDLCYQLC